MFIVMRSEGGVGGMRSDRWLLMDMVLFEMVQNAYLCCACCACVRGMHTDGDGDGRRCVLTWMCHVDVDGNFEF